MRRQTVEVVEFVNNVIASGNSPNPIPPLGRALAVLSGADRRLKGKLIALLTDGGLTDSKAVTEELRKLNKRKDVMVHTILYGHQDKKAEQVLRTIGKENSGEFKFVKEEEGWRPK